MLYGLLLTALFAFQDFNSEEPSERQEAYKQLESLEGEEKTKAIEALGKLQLRRHDAFDREWKRLHNNFMGLGGLGGEGMLEFLAKWMAARDAACRIIFDTKAYPMPPGRRASKPMQGHGTVRARLGEAVELFEAIGKKARSASQQAMRGGWARRLQALKDRVGLLREGDAVLSRQGSGWKSYAVRSFAFLDAMALIGEKKFKEAIKIYAGKELSQAQKIVFFLVYSQIIEYYNVNKIRTAMNGSEKQAAAKLNEYRMAIGVLPYEHDPQLTKAIKNHFLDIAAGLTERGHISKVPGKRTATDRARKEGWKGSASENLASAGPVRAVEIWFWDGGHGRNNMTPNMEKIGFGSGKGSGFTNGSGGPLVVPRPPPPFTYGR